VGLLACHRGVIFVFLVCLIYNRSALTVLIPFLLRHPYTTIDLYDDCTIFVNLKQSTISKKFHFTRVCKNAILSFCRTSSDLRLTLLKRSFKQFKNIPKGPGKSIALLSAFRNGLSTPDSAFRSNVTLACFCCPPQCDVRVLPAGGERWKAESMLTLAESRAVNLP